MPFRMMPDNRAMLHLEHLRRVFPTATGICRNMYLAINSIEGLYYYNENSLEGNTEDYSKSIKCQRFYQLAPCGERKQKELTKQSYDIMK
jgi:hypothetical protein